MWRTGCGHDGELERPLPVFRHLRAPTAAFRLPLVVKFTGELLPIDAGPDARDIGVASCVGGPMDPESLKP